MSSRFEYVLYIRTTASQLWQALTLPAFTRQYWAETWQESDWRVGSAWRLMIPDGRVGDSGEVVEIEPASRLVLRWKNEFMPELAAEGETRVTYLLQPEDDYVKLTLTHEADRPDSKVIAVMSEGWIMLLSSLKSMLETGQPIAATTRWPEGV